MKDIITLDGIKYKKMENTDKDIIKQNTIRHYCQKLKIFYDSFSNMFPDGGDVTDLFKLERKYFFDSKYNAVVFFYEKWVVIMLPITILNRFEFKDHFFINNLCNSVSYSWGGTSFDPELSSKTTALSAGNSKSAKISRVSFFTNLHHDSNKTILEVISIIREYYHRIFYASEFRGTGKNYKDYPNECNCLGCNLVGT